MKRFEFLLSKEELQFLKEVVYLEPFLDNILGMAGRRRHGDCFKARFFPDELRDYADALLYASGYVIPPEKAVAFETLGRKLEKQLPKRLRIDELRTELYESTVNRTSTGRNLNRFGTRAGTCGSRLRRER